MANSRKSQPVFQFHIELRDIKPKIWRRIQVENMTLNQFHECIQIAMGWSNSHLHVFEIEGERYSDTYCWKQEEVAAQIELCRNVRSLRWLGAVIVALASTGLRISELVSLRGATLTWNLTT